MSIWDNKVDVWTQRIESALEFRREFGIEDRWATLEAMYSNLKNSGAEIGPNLLHGMGDALVSQLGVVDPVLGVSPSPRDPRSLESYVIVERLDNWFMTELKIPKIMQDIILHAYLYGRGIVKIGYDSEWGFDPDYDLGTVVAPWGMTMTQFDKQGRRIEFGPGKPGMPWVAPVLPHDFVVPTGTKYLDSAPWVAHRVYRHIDLLRKDVKYSKTRDLQPTHSLQDIVDSYTKVGTTRNRHHGSPNFVSKDSTKRAEFVELWEIHNRVDGRVRCKSEMKMHRDDPDPNQIDGVPFQSLTFVRHPRSFWNTPTSEYLRFHQAEEYDIALHSSKQRRISVLKYLVRRGSMKQEELDKALSPDVGISAFMEQGADPARDVTTMPQANNAQLWQEAEFTRRNARESVGLSRNRLGEFDASSRRTATEAAEVAAGSEKRMGFRTGAVADMYMDTFRTINQIIFSNWKNPRFIQVKEGQWPQFTGEEIQAQYSYELGFGLDKARDPISRRREAANTYLMFRDDPLVDPIGLRRYLSRAFNDIEFSQIFAEDIKDANVSLQLPEMQQVSGGVS